MSQPLQIDYATPDADGLPAYHPEAEAVIDFGGGPTKLKRFFHNRNLASRYFAKSMSRRHGIDTIGPNCVRCLEPAEFVAAVQWKAKAQPPLLVPVLRAEEGVIYPTVHPLCAACLTPWAKTCRRLWWVLRGIGWLQWLWVPVLISTVIPAWRVIQVRQLQWVWPTWLVLWLTLMVAKRIVTLWYVRCTPGAIRGLRRRHVECLGLHDFSTRAEAATSTDAPQS